MFKDKIEPEQKVEEVRKPRVPMGGRRQKLQLSDADAKALAEAGWTPRWISDKDGRVQQAQSGGYVFVTPEEAPSIGQFSLSKGGGELNGKVSMIVSKGDAEAIRGYLMKIRTEYYEEDQRNKEGANMAYEESLNRDQPGGNVVDNQYVPRGHVNRV